MKTNKEYVVKTGTVQYYFVPVYLLFLFLGAVFIMLGCADGGPVLPQLFRYLPAWLIEISAQSKKNLVNYISHAAYTPYSVDQSATISATGS